MSLKKLTLLFFAILAFQFLATGLVFSQMTEREKPTKPGLGLTPEQKEKVRIIVLGGRKEQIQRQADLKIAYVDLKELMMHDKLDRTQITRKLEQIGTLRTRLEIAKVETMIKLRDILTKEQVQNLKERKMHHMFNRKVIEKRIRLNQGRVQRWQEQRMGPGPMSEEPALPQEERLELSIAPEEPLAEPELNLLEEELAPLFEPVEPVPPMEELPPLPAEEPPTEE